VCKAGGALLTCAGQVERCKYCVAEGETLLTMMRHIGGEEDMNWLRLWAFNGADDGLISLPRSCVFSSRRLQELLTGSTGPIFPAQFASKAQ